jgi:membrane protease YdiL (CAAX protease family)
MVLIVAASIVRDGPWPMPLMLASVADSVEGFIRSNTLMVVYGVVIAVTLFVLRVRGTLTAQGLTVPAREVGAHHPLAWFLGGAITWVTAGVAIGAASGFLKISATPDSARESVMILGVGYGASLTVGLFLAHLLGSTAPGAGLSFAPSSLLQGVALMAVAWPFVSCVGALAAYIHVKTGGSMPDAIAHPTLRALVDHPRDPWVWAQTSMAVLLAPVQEELVYRGMLQSACVAATGRVWLGVIITSAIFAAAHVAGGAGVPWYAAVALFSLATCMGLAFERTGRLGVSIGMHITFNLVNVVLAVYGVTA